MNAIAKRNPPRPWFQERLKVVGYATMAKTIGATRIRITAIFELKPKMW
jgi:hypothetical protein